MPRYRVTIRYGERGGRYHVEDADAAGLADALDQAIAALPDGAEATANLAEIRLQSDPDDREYVPE